MRPNVFGYGTGLVLSPKINSKLGRIWWNRRLVPFSGNNFWLSYVFQLQQIMYIHFVFTHIHWCVLALYTRYLPKLCEEKKSQAYYSGGIRTHDKSCVSQTETLNLSKLDGVFISGIAFKTNFDFLLILFCSDSCWRCGLLSICPVSVICQSRLKVFNESSTRC